jgi:hypothetical protein
MKMFLNCKNGKYESHPSVCEHQDDKKNEKLKIYFKDSHEDVFLIVNGNV